MKQEGNTIFAEGNKKLYIKKLDLLTSQYTCGTVMLPVEGVLQPTTVTPEDVMEVYDVVIGTNSYKIQANSYGDLVSGLIRLKYSIDDELALIANSRIRDISAEDKDFQEWRTECKRIAKKYIDA